jgi:hypothetical protein
MDPDDGTYHNCPWYCMVEVKLPLELGYYCKKKCDKQTRLDGSHEGPHHCPDHGDWYH